jgi:hypothetical protein
VLVRVARKLLGGSVLRVILKHLKISSQSDHRQCPSSQAARNQAIGPNKRPNESGARPNLCLQGYDGLQCCLLISNNMAKENISLKTRSIDPNSQWRIMMPQ